MAVSGPVDSVMQQQEQQRQHDPESFWSLVTKKNSSNKLSKLLTAWVQESMKPPCDRDGTLEHSESARQMELPVQANGGTKTGLPNVYSAKCAAIESGYTEYAYHKEDTEGTPRKDSPDDVIATMDAMQGRRQQPSARAPLPPPASSCHSSELASVAVVASFLSCDAGSSSSGGTRSSAPG